MKKVNNKSDIVAQELKALDGDIKKASFTTDIKKRSFAEEIKQNAQAEAARIIAQAKADAEQQIIRARDDLRAQVANLAVKGAEQILRKEINPTAHAELLDRLKAEL